MNRKPDRRLKDAPSHEPGGGAMPTKCILLVEDDADVRLLIEHVLISAGCDVEATGTMLGGTDLLRAAPTTRRRG
jgi:hypothetical protein